jgi:hypothetical protein
MNIPNKASMFPIGVMYDGMRLSIPAGEIVAIEEMPDNITRIYVRDETDPWVVETNYDEVMEAYVKVLGLL